MRRRPGLVIHPIVFLEIKTLIGSTEGHGLVIHPIVFQEAKTFIGSTEGHGLVIHPIVFFSLIFLFQIKCWFIAFLKKYAPI